MRVSEITESLISREIDSVDKLFGRNKVLHVVELCQSPIEKFFLLYFLQSIKLPDAYNYVKVNRNNLEYLNDDTNPKIISGIAFKYNQFSHLLIPQYPAGNYFLDFALFVQKNSFEVRYDLECDGTEFHTSLRDKQKDAKREVDLQALGWRTERFSGYDIRYEHFRVESQVRKLISESHRCFDGAF